MMSSESRCDSGNDEIIGNELFEGVSEPRTSNFRRKEMEESRSVEQMQDAGAENGQTEGQPKEIAYDFGKIDAALTRLASQPPKRKRQTKKLVIEQYKERIRKLLDSGYRISDIVHALAEGGVQISGATIRQYLRESARQSAAGEAEPKREEAAVETGQSLQSGATGAADHEDRIPGEQ